MRKMFSAPRSNEALDKVLPGYVVGGGGFGGGAAIPAPGPASLPGSGTGSPGGCSAAEFGGAEAFAYIMFDALAAGAITAGTEAFDFHDAVQSDYIVTNNLIPNNFRALESRLFVGVEANTDLGIETEALFADLFILEAIAGLETQRYPLWKLGQRNSALGVSTATSTGGGIAAYSGDISPHGVPYDRTYHPTTSYSSPVHSSVTVTTIEIVQFCWNLFGVKGAGISF